jgi:hypothetical protein
MTLTRVSGDDVLIISAARYLGSFKPNSGVPCEADVYLLKNAYSL